MSGAFFRKKAGFEALPEKKIKIITKQRTKMLKFSSVKKYCSKNTAAFKIHSENIITVDSRSGKMTVMGINSDDVINTRISGNLLVDFSWMVDGKEITVFPVFKFEGYISVTYMEEGAECGGILIKKIRPEINSDSYGLNVRVDVDNLFFDYIEKENILYIS